VLSLSPALIHARDPGYNWPEIATVIFSLVAIAISGFFLLEGRWQHRDERNIEILDAVYEDRETLALQELIDFYAEVQLRNPRSGFILATPYAAAPEFLSVLTKPRCARAQTWR